MAAIISFPMSHSDKAQVKNGILKGDINGFLEEVNTALHMGIYPDAL